MSPYGKIAEAIYLHRGDISHREFIDTQMLCLHEEVGEAIEARGTPEFVSELADVVIVCRVIEYRLDAPWALREERAAVSLDWREGLLTLAMQAGQAAQAWRRYTCRARTTATEQEVMHAVRQVAMTALLLGDRAEIDLEVAISAKLDVIVSRGGR